MKTFLLLLVVGAPGQPAHDYLLREGLSESYCQEELLHNWPLPEPNPGVNFVCVEQAEYEKRVVRRLTDR